MRLVRASARLFATDVPEAVVDETSHPSVEDPVVRLSPIVPGSHELQMAQQGELVADGGHGETEGVREVSHGQLVVSQRVDQSQAQRVREREEDFDGL